MPSVVAAIPPKPQIKTEWVFVTPALAEEWLKLNHPNQRNISPTSLQANCNDLSENNWTPTHQGICFGKHGYLIDGQHRLYAIIKTGKGIWLMVSHNPEGDIHDPIDRNRARSVAFLTDTPPRTAGALAILHRFEHGLLTSTTPVTAPQTFIAREHNRQYLDFIDDNPSINRKSSIVSGVRAGCVWVMPIDAVKVLEFLQKVLTGEMIARGDPAYAFRNWRERVTGASTMKMALATINCLRYYIQGKPVTNVYDTESGYRATVAKRRAMRIPNTPGTDIVTGLSWGNFRGDETT